MKLATKSSVTDRRLNKLFHSEILSIARQYQREGRPLLAGNPDLQLPTYYERRLMTRMSKADFENGSCRNPEELSVSLNRMWTQQGFGELSEVATNLGKLAERLKEAQPETAEVSPFVYAMY